MEKDTSYSFNKPASKDNNTEDKRNGGYTSSNAPQISLPKGGGAIRSIDEKFSVNAANGTSGFSISFPFSASRNGFMPVMALSYNSGAGNGIFGLGWNAEPAAITRRTANKFPEYYDATDSDIFVFSGAEDLVPVYHKDESGSWIRDSSTNNNITVTRYRPRLEGGFARIERITEATGNVYWKVTSSSNVVSVFGKSRSAQLYDPSDPTKIFKWLFEFSYDDKGSCFQYEYKKEDKTNVSNQLHEKNRLNDFSLCNNVYLKRVKYCNKNHFQRNSDLLADDPAAWSTFLNGIEYLLELVMDYGEHDVSNPQPDDNKGWPCRADAFSDYRAGFEIRTYRLCQRILMFHHFSELGTTPCLVRSMDMEYDAGTAFTFLKAITQKGYIRQSDGSYSQKSLPPVAFGYQPLEWNTEIKSLPQGSIDNLPGGIDDAYYQWIDLFHEGIAGILTEQSGAWYYKGNTGDGIFEGITPILSKPSLIGITTGALHFADLEARGQQFLVSNGLDGYYELNDNNEWLPFKNFRDVPNISMHDPNLKMLDLNGDGMADILISEDDVFTWYASKGKEGFEMYKKLSKVFDEEKGPNIVFSDSTESIVLADMSGDGLMDIVRIRFSEVCYWPNLGYGIFGAKVNMSNAPVFDNAENFNPRYVKLADLDGSGTTDIIYIGKNTFKIYFNQSGNSWSEANTTNGLNPLPFPKIDEHANVATIDLLGNGTGCIVWSSSLPQYVQQPLQYIDLMGGKKPHVMTSYHNNMGKEVTICYKPSTFYYLQDKKAGAPWITKLPFPVQCVSEVVQTDQITKVRFANQYSYHHGYYDHAEREFRGFGRVEQTDTEDFDKYKRLSAPDGSIQIVDEGFHQPPVLTKTWFHTGAFLDKEKILTQFAHEYYSNNIVPEKELIDPILPANLTIHEWREALRTCKGLLLRSEVYSLDGSNKQQHPYTTSHNSCFIQLLQPKLDNPYAVFMVQQGEGLSYNYERDPADPRIGHSMTIETDPFGNVLKTALISYGRKSIDTTLTPAEQAEQNRTYIVYTQNNVTNQIDTATAYRLPVSYETITYELTGLIPGTGDYFSISEIENEFEQSSLIPYEKLPSDGNKEKRITEQVKTLFLKDDLSGPLEPGVMESLGLSYQSFRLSLTPGLLDFIFGDKVTDDLLLSEGKYVHNNDDNYWIASQLQTLDANNFYQIIEINDPFENKTQVIYDSGYHFFIEQTIDSVGNVYKIDGFNYRTLSPYLMNDVNGNRSGVRTDELGMVTRAFIMGKEGENKGDLMDVTFVESSPNDQPGTILEYDLFNYQNTGKPNFSKTMMRETHYYDTIQTGDPVKWQTSYAYSDGGGQVIMQKVQAEPGLALQEDGDGTFVEIDTTPNLRWVGNGRTILNNKGKPVKQFEPFFSTTFEFEDATQLVERGVTSLVTYDSAGRVIRTDFPNGTFAKVEFDSWVQRSFDSNDTVLESQWYNDRIITPVLAIATPEEIAAANKAAAHANTPAVVYFDSLGRNFLAVADNGSAGKYKTSTSTDIEGNTRSVKDPAGNMVMQYKYDMLGAQLYRIGTDSGERWTINNVMGKPMRDFDSRTHQFRYEYDALLRPVNVFVQTGNGTEINTERMIYGEGIANDNSLNVRGKVYRHFDTAGISVNNGYDFKGNPLQSTRQLCSEYKSDIDWNTNPAMQQSIFTISAVFDALNRPVTSTLPDQSIITQTFNEANLLNKVEVQIRGSAEKTVFVKDINYDAKRQRQNIVYGNDTATSYQYDPQTFRLIRLITTGKSGTDLLQQFSYTYDPAGNPVSVKDEAQQTVFFNNTVVSPSCEYVYDAIYRLVNATGREHIGQNQPPSPHDEFRTNLAMPGDGTAMRNYSQTYQYDAVGNISQMIHAAGTGSWTRTYLYEAGSNRLNSTTVNNNAETYAYDPHGNILSLAHLPELTWNFRDVLQQADLGGGGTAYYVYDNKGKRVRKVIERQGGIKEERLYLGGFEVYLKTDGGGNVQEATETLHVTDGSGRIAMIETKTIKDGVAITTENQQPMMRYQYSNHLGSSSLELDGGAAIISYEEYYPFGSTSYQANNAAINAAAKRYRYTGMERDDETGLEYHTARYYLPWLGRWLSADPIGLAGGLNLYAYVSNSPAKLVDPDGNDGVEASQRKSKLNPAFAGGWTYKGLPGVTFFEFEPGTYAYTNDNNTIHAVDNKTFSIILKNGIPVFDYLDDAVYEIPAKLLSNNPGQISSAGTRWNPNGLRQFYTNPVALDKAVAGFIKEAEIWEAGHGCAGCHIEFLTNGPVPDSQLDMNRYNRVALLTKVASDLVGMTYDPRSPTTLLRIGLNHTLALTPKNPAVDRAQNTQRAVLDGDKVVSREITEATGKERFSHTTTRASLPHSGGSAAVNIADTQSIRVTPGGENGHWGEGAYAYEAKPGDMNSQLPIVQFSVKPGTAIEKITIAGEQPIIRLVPPEGNTLSIVNPITNLTQAELAEARKWLDMLKEVNSTPVKRQ